MSSAHPSLVVIRVTDLEAARAFYEALGLDFQLEKHGKGPEHLSHAASGFVFEIYPRRSTTDSTAAVRLGFSVPSLTAVLTRLNRTEAEVVSKPQESTWGLRAVLRDPDGHTVELLQPE